MSTKSIKITYTINPPSTIASPPDFPKSKITEYPISPTGMSTEEDKAGKAYYGELRKALEAAKAEVGEDLTRWRDLLGKSELNKEPKKVEDDEDENRQDEELI